MDVSVSVCGGEWRGRGSGIILFVSVLLHINASDSYCKGEGWCYLVCFSETAHGRQCVCVR